MKKITIGITAFNEGQYLQEAWDSVVAQTNQLWEAILVLDGGADEETNNIFNNIVHESLTKIKLDDNHQGPYYARSVAINNANSQWYCQLDADDLLPNNFVSLVINTINNNNNADILYGDVESIRDDTKSIMHYNNIDNNQLPFFLYGHVPIKRDLFFELNGFNNKLFFGSADRDFLIRCAVNNRKFVYIGNQIVYIIRKRTNSNSAKWTNNLVQRTFLAKYYHRQYALFFLKSNYYEYFFNKDIKPMLIYLYQQKDFFELVKTIIVLGYESRLIIFFFIFKLLFKY